MKKKFLKKFYSEKVGISQSSLYHRFFESKKTLTFDDIMKRALARITSHHEDPMILKFLGKLP